MWSVEVEAVGGKKDLRVSCAENIGNNRPLISQTVKSTGAFNERLDALFGQLDNLWIDIAMRSGFGVNDRRRNILSKLGADAGKVGARCIVLDGVRELQNLSDEWAISNHLGSPVLCSQSCCQNIICGWIILSECEIG